MRGAPDADAHAGDRGGTDDVMEPSAVPLPGDDDHDNSVCARRAPERPDAEGAPGTPLGWRGRVGGARTVDIVSGGMIGARDGRCLYSVGCRCEGREMWSVSGCDVVCGV